MVLNASNIDLNFLELEEQRFRFEIFRCSVDDWEPSDEDRVNFYQYPLPPDWKDYWVSLDEELGWEKLECESILDKRLTCHYLYLITSQRAIRSGHPQYGEEERKIFSRRVYTQLSESPHGDQTVWVKPFYLKSAQSFGFILDFQFKSKEERATRKTQELSLSLKHGRENRDFYVDRRSKVEVFFEKFHESLFPVESPFQVKRTLLSQPTRELATKTFELGNQRQETAPFAGVKKYGPYEEIPGELKLLFLFREQDRELSRDLFRGLRGDTFGTFPGFGKIFGVPLTNENVSGQAVDGFSKSDLEPIFTSHLLGEDGGATIPILLTPFNREGGPGDSEQYFRAKYEFLKRGLPCQVVSLPTVREQNRLKWSISNIALQIFAKAGGIPWRLRPHSKPSLILGLGQAHRKNEDDEIQKFFAYSVQTDSSGLYKDLQILGTSEGEDDYLQQLRQNISKVIVQYADEYDRFVVHSPFFLKFSEMDAIEKALKENNEYGELVFMNFNTDSYYFGYSQASGSLVPIEGSYTSIDHKEYLVWFEGLRHKDATAYKRFGRPAHVRFRYPRSDISQSTRTACLQDAFLLSGANWRGFKGKAIPISIHYARIIAQYYKNFQALGLPDIDLAAIRPWFL